MNLLVVDTATRSCSVALMEKGRLRAESTVVTGETHSRHVMALVVQTLENARWEWTHIDGLVISLGPGTFTGLRIGLATVKGLAMALDKPLKGISTLEALAWQAGPRSDLICSALDARRNQVYYAFYRQLKGSQLKIIRQSGVATMAEVLEQIQEPCLLVGNAADAYGDALQEADIQHLTLAPGPQNILRAASIGRLAAAQIDASGWDEAALLDPIYLRKSDAEIKFGHDSDLPMVLESLPKLKA